MAYTPVATDTTRPLDTDPAESAQLEFRTLKIFVNNLIAATGSRVPARNCLLTALQDANGNSMSISGSGGLNVAINASGSAQGAIFTWAAGLNGAGGALDIVQTVGADIIHFALAIANNTVYVAADYAGVSLPPIGSATLAPPQFDQVYNRNAQAVLQFGGAVASTVFLDDFGQAWTNQGGAKVQTNSFKFGTGGLGGAGAVNALNGTTDFVKTVGFTTFGPNGWSMRAWVNPSALPAAAAKAVIAAGINAGSFGAILSIYNNAGTIKFAYDISSTGAAFNIAASVQGTTTPVIGTYYFVELTYDILTQTYRLYVNGAQEAFTASALTICPCTSMNVGGMTNTGVFVSLTGYVDKFELLPYCQNPAATAYAVPVAAPNVATQGYASDWFDTVNYLMQQVSAPSIAAATNPSFVQKNRLYVGEANCAGGAAITSVASYALQGKFRGLLTVGLPAAATVVPFNTNMGTTRYTVKFELTNLIAEAGYVPGDIVENVCTDSTQFTPLQFVKDRNISSFTSGGTGSGFVLSNKTSGVSGAVLTQANWAYRLSASRDF